MPAMRQFFIFFRKRRNLQLSYSSEKPFGVAHHSYCSPKNPSTEDTCSLHDPSTDPPTSSSAAKPAMMPELDSPNTSDPTFSLSFWQQRMKSSAKRLQENEHLREAEERAKERMKLEKRESRPASGDPAVLNYSCDIEARSPDLGTQNHGKSR